MCKDRSEWVKKRGGRRELWEWVKHVICIPSGNVFGVPVWLSVRFLT